MVEVQEKGRRRTGLSQFHLGQAIGQVIVAPAAVGRRQGQAEQAFPGPMSQDFLGKFSPAVEVHRPFPNRLGCFPGIFLDSLLRGC